MDNTASEKLIKHLNDFLASKIGIYFPEERLRDFQRGISLSAEEFGFYSLEEFTEWLISSPLTKEKVEKLANHLTIGETYFFRGKDTFNLLEKKILPDLIKHRQTEEQTLKIWSAGASSGEEAYSIAILLKKLLKDLSKWKITILATDINQAFLKKASEGLYNEWSFRNTPTWVKEEFFRRKDNDLYQITPEIRNMVKFFYLNLADSSYPSLLNDLHDVDIIFCRNVLMYFSPEVKKQVIERLYLSLKEKGWLVVSPIEASQQYFSQFDTVNFPGALFYRKKKRYLVSEEKQKIDNQVPILRNLKIKKDFDFEISAEENKDLALTKNKPSFIKKIETNWKINQNYGSFNDLYDRVLTFYKAGRYKEITEGFNEILSSKVLELNKDDSSGELLVLIARAYANLGKLNEAKRWCEKVISHNKLNPDFYYLLATILQEQGKIKEAIEALNKAIYVDHDFVLAHFALGNLKRLLGNNRESDKYFKNTLELLQNYEKEDILLEAEGITAGRLAEIIISIIERKNE